MSQGTSKFIPQYFKKGSKVIVWEREGISNIETYGFITADGIYWGRWFETMWDISREEEGWITEVNNILYPCKRVSYFTTRLWQDAIDGVKYYDNLPPHPAYAIEKVI